MIAMKRCASLVLAGVLGAPIPALSQHVTFAEVDGDEQPTVVLEEWKPPISNMLLGTVLLGALASIPMEITAGLDEGIPPSTSGHDSFLRSVPRVLGSNGLHLGLAGAAAAIGHVTGDERMTRVGLRSAETLAVTGLVTVAMKSSIGRSRPGYARQPDEFNSFSSVNGFWSFPSGHTSTAFALATVLTLELGEEAPWVPYVAFPLATWVGTSRVIDERHWPTDVIAGAALGILVAQIWHGIRGPSSGSWSGLEPGVWSDPDGGTLLGLSWAFGNGGRPNREL